MDETQSLKDTENSLRDFIQITLLKINGSEWIEKSGVAPERILRWSERKLIEQKKHTAGTIDERLIYYADFYDLKTILHKNWSLIFAQVFGEWREMETLLSILEKYRDTDAHRRELLSFQKHLILGIGGEIRSKIVKYRSMNETGKEYFPRFESVRDNYGNIWTPEKEPSIHTNIILRAGDKIEFIVTASDPEGLPLFFRIMGFTNWQSESTLEYTIKQKDISLKKGFMIHLKSPRDYHAMGQDYDDVKFFYYQILPN